ncbi:Flp pilus assembly protein CpaB [Desulforamulus putei DSM 12395]|uniref:Flp pilus assembly protein CpaB n=1 Tax=Desulforamulus putei DSM 12395 TaxID=1121429 RepID=A0A1M5D3P7_9FIRM|nr:SAF domain-containing protein [Desulforamulus putei]SHF61586.1 Flp pilus assembly protein CpaB [Desulforamulus putei DSM 12395]
MKKIKKYLHIVLAVALATGGGLSAWYFINSNTPTEKVVVTQGKLPSGTILNSSNISTKLVSKSAIPPGAITNPDEVMGKTLNIPVLGNEILQKDHVTAGKGSLAARLATVAPGKVAVDLPQETAQGLKGLEVGDRVNVYGEVGVSTGEGKAATMVDKVAANAIVLYVPNNQEMQPDKTGAIIIACDPSEEQRIAQVLTGGKKVTLFLQQEVK